MIGLSARLSDDESLGSCSSKPLAVAVGQTTISGIVRVSLCLVLSAWLGCRSEPEPAAVAAPARVRPARIEVAFAGCERVVSGLGCELTPLSVFTLWLPVAFDQVQLFLGDQEVKAEDRVVADGYQVTLAMPAQAAEVRLTHQQESLLRLPLIPSSASPALEAAKQAKDRGEYPQALELAEQVQREGSPLERLLAEGVKARVYLRLGRVDEASELLARTTPGLFAVGQISEAARDLFARLYILLHRQHRIDAAEAWFERFRSDAMGYPLGRVLVHEHAGMLHASAGKISEALRAYGLAERGYERLGQRLDVRRVQQNRIGLLGDLGQVAEAHELQARMLPAPAEEHPCSKAELYIKHSWLTLLRVEDGELEYEAAVAELFGEAERWLGPCADPELRVSQLINRGLWALRRGDLGEAGELSQTLLALPGRSPYLEGWALDFQGRLALAQKRPARARAAFQRERELGRAAAALDSGLRALLGLAAVARALGEDALAAQHLGDAILALERAQQLAPLGALGHSHYAARRQAAQRLVELLVEQGKVKDAYHAAWLAYRSALASQARSRNPSGLDRDAERRIRESLGEYRRRRQELDAELQLDWQVTSRERKVRQAARAAQLTELARLLEDTSQLLVARGPSRGVPTPAPGEYWLLTFPIAEGWLVFGADGSDVRVQRLSAAPGDDAPAEPALTHPVLQPFEAQLLAAQNIVLLPAGASRHWAFESWRLAGEPLAWRRLAFSAGLDRGPTEPEHEALPPARASLIVDPRGDLPFARREGSVVQAALGIAESRTLAGERATLASLLELFETSDHVHFAGHARGPDEPGGAALLLAGGASLEAWELFGLSSVPRQVVLSACSSGAGSRASLGAGWSLAQALLGAGAEWVIGPSGVLADGAAFAAQADLYRELVPGVALSQAFWRAQRRSEPRAGGATLRLFTR